ncbi:Brp/Blh family beta-carotene 15,15'-dioxygenase [Deinococcus arenicola]|uniref:Probable beta-carotene 15,15'-dioxygenase n=1 Tax=Deinococcus arenicola TaxID=2994950 RepID=A0ABU4DPS9_9DEIO|nr:Brp/Blh family beta-carotene 15,15'-dioxygenase [Deinococcus sp. ZS9-10]MDV6374439.1 Brp/Blh family beta-carotene 15,15'-dioxygenase [Deinococcus sp. ZS9-10]
MTHFQPSKPLLNPATPQIARQRPAFLLQFAVPWAAMLGLLGLHSLFPAVLERYALVPLLLSAVLFGLPHGALDHLVPLRQGWRLTRRWTGLGLFLLAYLGVVLLYLGVWTVWPMVAYWGFLLTSALHWGHGDLDFLERRLGRVRAWHSGATLLLRGSLPIVVPFLAFPDAYERLARGAAQAFHASLPAGPLWSASFSQGLTVIFVAVLLLSVADTLRCAASDRAAVTELAEVALLLLVFTQVPAELSIGLYFTLWHAWRHLGRLLELNSRPLKLRPVSVRGLRRLALDLTPITLIALGMLGGLFLWSAPRLHSAEDLTALYLALIAALTLPHALLVAVMDPAFARVVGRSCRDANS